MKIGVFGRGRMAAAILDACGSDVEVAWSLGREDVPAGPVDVAIDVAHGDGVEAHLAWAVETSTPLAIGTTGWSLPDLESRVGDRTGVLLAPNFSMTVALLNRLAAVIGGYAALSPAGDPYVVEHHHTGKRDAPSGTATLLAETLLRSCPRKTEWVLVDGQVLPHQLAVSSVRAGTAPGTHVVGLDTPSEVLEIRHAARSRAVFAEGALVAARWIEKRRGVHVFDEVAAEILAPLFARSAGGSGERG